MFSGPLISVWCHFNSKSNVCMQPNVECYLSPVGTIWVYSVYPPSYTPGEARYCHKTTFQFAFTVTTLTWVLLTLVFVCGSCFAVLTCCKTVRARRYLIPRRNTDYGGTSDFEEPIAGDVWLKSKYWQLYYWFCSCSSCSLWFILFLLVVINYL